LGHIVSKGGTRIDPKRAKGIQEVPLPSDKKVIQLFFGQINFVGRFIPIFAEIVKLISDMLKNGHDIKWSEEAKGAFGILRRLCVILLFSLVLITDYSKDFQLFYFASKFTVVDVLLQKNDKGMEQSVTFMSKTLQGAELNYEIMEKQAYALVKGLAYFKNYFLNARIVAYVPHPMVKQVLVQKECSGTRGRWITKIQEYDLEIKPTKLIRGQGLSKMMMENNLNAIQGIQVSEQANALTISLEHCPWYSDIFFISRI